MELYDEDGELVFDGVPVGPFRGRDAIARAYRERPPDDRIAVTQVEEQDGVVVARFAWERGGTGRMRIERRGALIRRLVVTFD